MIPRHRPPFGVQDVLTTLFNRSQRISVDQLEDFYANACGVDRAVLLPSARAGICWALRAAISQETIVLGPAYSCMVVHEAMARAGGRLRLVDVSPDSFLMDPKKLVPEESGNYAVVLGEIYGYRYDDDAGIAKGKIGPRIRIVDAAMTVPVEELFTRLNDDDFAVVSFGLGKCVYAGWGGMGLTMSAALADEVRNQRDAYLRPGDLLLSLSRWTQILVRTVAHARSLYGISQYFRSAPGDFDTLPSTWSGDVALSKEWYLPSTAVDRCLIFDNIQRRKELYDRRGVLARYYYKNLAGAAGITLPPVTPHAMSHYTILVRPQFRDAVRVELNRSGVDTGTLFRLAGYLSKDDYPNASRISSQVINLPLDIDATNTEIDYICERLIKAVAHQAYEKILLKNPKNASTGSA